MPWRQTYDIDRIPPSGDEIAADEYDSVNEVDVVGETRRLGRGWYHMG